MAKIRVCAFYGCNFRMSSVDKDPHLLCPAHVGWLCSLEQRCDTCKDWPDDQMKAYCKLQQEKARKKAHRDRKKLAAQVGSKQQSAVTSGHAHSMSSSESSFDSSHGKIVPFSPVIVPDDQVPIGSEQVVTSVVDKDELANPVVGISPLPQPGRPSSLDNVVCQDKVSQGPAVLPCSGVPLEEKECGGVGEYGLSTGRQNLVSCSTAGERLKSTTLAGIHPQQGLSIGQVGLDLVASRQDLKTPAKSVRRSVTGSTGRSSVGSFDPSVSLALEEIAYKYRNLSPRSQKRKMKEYLNETDPSLSSYTARSGKSRKDSTRSRRSGVKETSMVELGEAYYKSTESPCRFSRVRDESEGMVVETDECKSGEKRFLEDPEVPSPKKKEVSRELAQMVITGGVYVRSSARIFYKDESGAAQFVEPRLAEVRQGQSLGLRSGITPCHQESVSVPARPKSPEAGAAKSRSRETVTVGSSVIGLVGESAIGMIPSVLGDSIPTASTFRDSVPAVSTVVSALQESSRARISSSVASVQETVQSLVAVKSSQGVDSGVLSDDEASHWLLEGIWTSEEHF